MLLRYVRLYIAWRLIIWLHSKFIKNTITEDKSMLDTIHHIAIIGSDYEKSKHFYVDLLGFKVIRENYRKERDDYKIDLACGP